VENLKNDIQSKAFTPGAARDLASRMARAIQASLMVRYATDASANYCIATRIHSEQSVYGTYDAPELVSKIIEYGLGTT